MRDVAALFVAVVSALPAPGPSDPAGSIILRRKGEGSLALLAESISAEIKKKPGAAAPVVLQMTGDPIADAASLDRESKKGGTIYAVGADAAALTGEIGNAAVVALGIANPAKVTASATYVSVYPKLDRVFAFLADRLSAKRVGFLFSPTQNGEMALVFAKAAQAKGMGFDPIAVSSPGELARAMKEALPKIDVLLLAVDPLLFDRHSMDVIVEQSLSQKKPAVGFLSDLAPLGVAVCLALPSGDVAAKAVELSEFSGVRGKKRVEIDSVVVVLSRKAADVLKLDKASLGATDVR